MTGLFIASKPADLNHPYGHGKAEPLAGIVVAMGIFIAAIIIIIQSIYEIITPHHAPAGFTLLVLIIVVLTKEILFRYMIKVGENVGSVAIRSNAWHHRSDGITSLAAFIGISIALINNITITNCWTMANGNGQFGMYLSDVEQATISNCTSLADNSTGIFIEDSNEISIDTCW